MTYGPFATQHYRAETSTNLKEIQGKKQNKKKNEHNLQQFKIELESMLIENKMKRGGTSEGTINQAPQMSFS